MGGSSRRSGATEAGAFDDFVTLVRPRLQTALGATFGFDVSEDATAQALAFAWENWDRIASMRNPADYVFGVGRNIARRQFGKRRVELPAVAVADGSTGVCRRVLGASNSGDGRAFGVLVAGAHLQPHEYVVRTRRFTSASTSTACTNPLRSAVITLHASSGRTGTGADCAGRRWMTSMAARVSS